MICGILKLIFGTLLLIFVFATNSFDVWPCGCSASGDMFIITGYFSSMFPLYYGIGIALLCLGYRDIKEELECRTKVKDSGNGSKDVN